MARLNEMQDEIDRFRRERSALDQLMSKMAAYDAALRIMARHDLMAEFAAEILSITEAR